MYHFIPGHLDSDRSGCNENCIYTNLIAMGDRSSVTVTARDRVAEEARRIRKHHPVLWLDRLMETITGFLETIRFSKTGD
jgi:hypothetical protein